MSEPVDIVAEAGVFLGVFEAPDWNLAHVTMVRRLRDEVERLQADQTILLATAQDALECLIDWASYADEYFLVKHDFKGDVQRISSVTDRFRRNLQTGDSNE